MSWRRTVRAETIPLGECRVVETDDESLLVCRTGPEEFHAVEDLCTHDDGPLGEGRLEGCAIECPRHGARFDVRTGAVLSLPAPTPLRTWPLRVVDGWLEVDLEVEA